MSLVTVGAIPATLKWESVSDFWKAGLSTFWGEAMLFLFWVFVANARI